MSISTASVRPDNREWLIVDLGITFPEGENDPGVDVILPDVRFLEAQKKQIAGSIITHAHEDHIGAVLELWPRLQCPIYVTPFTAGMLKSKMADYGRGRDMPMKVVPLDSRFKAGAVRHRTRERRAFGAGNERARSCARRSARSIIRRTGSSIRRRTSGTPADPARLAALGDEGVLALVCDSAPTPCAKVKARAKPRLPKASPRSSPRRRSAWW